MYTLGFIGGQELLLILVIALVVFGGGKLAGVGKSLGQSVREFKDEVQSDEKEEKKEDEVKSENGENKPL